MSWVKKILPAKAFPCSAMALGLIALMALAAFGKSAQPRIDRILSTNIVGKPQVEIHFATEVNRTYFLQYNTNSFASTNWFTLSTSPALPVTNHAIIYDSRTNKARFYRLRVTP